MPRTHFINPYTFIPLREEGPLLEPEGGNSHAWLAPHAFTGRIHCRLTFLTPFIIPGEQTPGTAQQPGRKELYLYQNRLALPGSRLRGLFFNLMRAINASPITQFQDRTILGRRPGTPRKGFIIKYCGQWYIQEVRDEYLVIHPNRDRKSRDHQGRIQEDRHGEEIIVGLQNRCEPATNPEVQDSSGNFVPIPDYQSNVALNAQGQAGTLYWQKPLWGPTALRTHKRYVAEPNSGTPERESGNRWVKFSAWAGQDGENRLPDLLGNIRTHWNQWHVVDLDAIDPMKRFPLTDDHLQRYYSGLQEMAELVKEYHELPALAQPILDGKKLEKGTFVYFLENGGSVLSFGRHYHYLYFQGTIADKVERACPTSAPCLVQELAGRAKKGEEGVKSRLWFEMALGPEKDQICFTEKNLRILASQIPKAAQFYLQGGSYQDPRAKIRGRKFYWHDPQWNKPMWDNEDLKEGSCAFENPLPGENRKQWAVVPVLGLKADGAFEQISFEFTIRAMNLSNNELNLLLTALVGLQPCLCDENDGTRVLRQSDPNAWCHKVGHARPFLGSAYVSILGMEKVAFDFTKNSWAPVLQTEGLLEKCRTDLIAWQKRNFFNDSGELKHEHLKCLRRVLHFDGAYQEGEGEARITYPLGQENVPGHSLTWIGVAAAGQPKPYIWFKNKNDLLPIPKPGEKQSLEVYVRPAGSGGARGGGGLRGGGPPPRRPRGRR